MKKGIYFFITLITILLIVFINCEQPRSSSSGGGDGGGGDDEDGGGGGPPPTWSTILMGVTGKITNAYGITVDSSGNIYATGKTNGALDGQPHTAGGSYYNLFIVKYNSNGVKQWTRLLGVASKNTCAYGITLDSSGNIYATGETHGALDGETYTAGGIYSDLFIVKYNSSGVKQWTRLLGVVGADTVANGIAVDSDGNIYSTGYTEGTLDGKDLTGTRDLFIVKYESNGDKQWTRLLGATGKITQAFGIKCFRDLFNMTYIYATGETYGELDGEDLTGNRDLFIVKYNIDGNLQWTRLLGVIGTFTCASSIALDVFGSIYSTGWTGGDLGGESDAGPQDLFVVKYSPGGNLQWTRLLGAATTSVTPYGISINSTNGDIYTSGYVYGGNLDGQIKVGITYDMFVVKHDSTGIKQWTRLLGVAGADTKGRGIAVDSATGNAYVTGFTNGNLDGKIKTGSEDLFIVKYNSSGVKQ